MLKNYLFILIGIGMLSLVGSYTAPTYNAVNFSLCSGYTAPTYNDVNFSLALSDACTTDTCTCAGLNEDWKVDLSDYCILTTDCDLGTGKLSFTGTGNFTCDARIDTTNMGDIGSGGVLYINDECRIWID